MKIIEHKKNLLFYTFFEVGKENLSDYDVVFLAESKIDAIKLFSNKNLKQECFSVIIKDGKVHNSIDMIDNFLSGKKKNFLYEGYDRKDFRQFIDEKYVLHLRKQKQGFRYFTYYSPKQKESILMYVSLYPKEDLEIIKKPKKGI